LGPSGLPRGVFSAAMLTIGIRLRINFVGIRPDRTGAGAGSCGCGGDLTIRSQFFGCGRGRITIRTQFGCLFCFLCQPDGLVGEVLAFEFVPVGGAGVVHDGLQFAIQIVGELVFAAAGFGFSLRAVLLDFAELVERAVEDAGGVCSCPFDGADLPRRWRHRSPVRCRPFHRSHTRKASRRRW